MSPSLSEEDARAALARADRWLYEQGRIALHRVHEINPDAALRSIKARTEILFWWRYVSAKLNSKDNENLLLEFERNDLGLLLSIFRHNPELSSLFFALFFSLKGKLTEFEKNDVDILANYLFSYPRERTLFRTLDHCHSTSLFFEKSWPNETARNLLRESCLPFDGNILVHNEEILYAITHTLFYASDFGKDLSLLREFQNAPLVEFLAYLARVAVDDNDLDILSELLLCLMFIGEAETIDKKTFEFLIGSQSPQGFWPATQSVTDAVEADDIPQEQIPFFAHYHTTILARDVLARHLSCSCKEISPSTISLRNTVLKERRPPQHSESLSDNFDISEFTTRNPRLRDLIHLLNFSESQPKHEGGKFGNYDKLLHNMSNNDFVGVAVELPFIRPAPHIEKLVRFFHSANKSKLIGYGFPNPYGKNYDADRVIMALAGDVIEKKICGWNNDSCDLKSR
jgi:hypothetical protein